MPKNREIVDIFACSASHRGPRSLGLARNLLPPIETPAMKKYNAVTVVMWLDSHACSPRSENLTWPLLTARLVASDQHCKRGTTDHFHPRLADEAVKFREVP